MYKKQFGLQNTVSHGIRQRQDSDESGCPQGFALLELPRGAPAVSYSDNYERLRAITTGVVRPTVVANTGS